MKLYDFAPQDLHHKPFSEPTDLMGRRLVPRKCACRCGKTFKTLAGSSQEYATQLCWQTNDQARRAYNAAPTLNKGGLDEWRPDVRPVKRKKKV